MAPLLLGRRRPAACGKRGRPAAAAARTPQAVTGLSWPSAATSSRSRTWRPARPRTACGSACSTSRSCARTRRAIRGGRREGRRVPQAGRRERHRAAPARPCADTSAAALARHAPCAWPRARSTAGGSPASTPVATLVVRAAPARPARPDGRLTGDAVALPWAGTVPSPRAAVPQSVAEPRPRSPSPDLAAPRRQPPRRPAAPSRARAPAPVRERARPALAVALAVAVADPRAARPRVPDLPPQRPGAAATGRPLRSAPQIDEHVRRPRRRPGQRWCYVVGHRRSPPSRVVESGRSNEACVTVRDIVPPAAPDRRDRAGRRGRRGGLVEPVHRRRPRVLSRLPAGPGGARERVGEVAPPETVAARHRPPRPAPATSTPSPRWTRRATRARRPCPLPAGGPEPDRCRGLGGGDIISTVA